MDFIRMNRAAVLLAAAVAMVPVARAGAGPKGGEGVEPSAVDVAPAEWPQFRGPGGIPVSDNPDLPLHWSTTENVEWVAEIPGMGWSSPIVVGGKVFLTTAVSAGEMKQPSLGVDFSNEYAAELQKDGVSEEELGRRVYARDMEMPDEVSLSYRLLCLDLETGAVDWSREFHAGPPPVGRHRKNSFTSETPVTDGRAVYVYVAHLGLWAYDLRGELLWHTPLQAYRVYLDFGGGASPALWKDRLFILNDNEESSFAAAFDTATGEPVWRTERTGMGVQGRHSGWSTPFVWTHGERAEVVTVGPGFAISYAPESGEELWRLPIGSVMTIASPFASEDLLYVTAGVSGEPVRPIAALRPGASGELALPAAGEGGAEALEWYDATAGGTYLPTPLLYGGRLYVLNDKGILSIYDARSGSRLGRTRIHPEAHNFTASPWAYRDRVFMINEEGINFALGTGDAAEIEAVNRLDEFVEATPAISGARLLIRTMGKLYSIREPESEPAG